MTHRINFTAPLLLNLFCDERRHANANENTTFITEVNKKVQVFVYWWYEIITFFKNPQFLQVSHQASRSVIMSSMDSKPTLTQTISGGQTALLNCLLSYVCMRLFDAN